MMDLPELPAFADDGRIHVVIETPRHAAAKFKFDEKLRCFVLSRTLTRGLAYPFDWGFVPSTCAEDGDPLDALVLHEVTSAPGIVLFCKPIGVLEVEQREKKKPKLVRNDRLFFSLCDENDRCDWSDIRDMPGARRKEFETFFEASIAGTGKSLEFIGWGGPKRAMTLLKKSVKTFREK